MIDWTCPDCWPPSEGKTPYKPCGLTDVEHIRVAQARAKAEKQAHEMMVQHRIDMALPEAIIKEIYDEAMRAVKRGQV